MWGTVDVQGFVQFKSDSSRGVDNAFNFKWADVLG